MAASTFNILSLCSGAGMLDLGVHLACGNARTVGYVEIEAYACAVLAARMEEGALDAAPVWTDLRAFDGRPWRGVVDCLIGGYPCFVAGTLILTEDGYRPIEQLAVGDLVLTHKGRWRPITAVMQRGGAQLRRLKAPGVPGVVTTDEHPFLARTRGTVWDNARRRNVRAFGDPEWVNAGDIGKSTHYLAQTLPPERECDLSPELLWVVGRWLADGWRQQRKPRGTGKRRTKQRGRVLICAGKHEAEDVRAGLRAAGLRWYEHEMRTSIRFNIFARDLWDVLDGFGKGAAGKTLPGWALELPREQAAALLTGYISGDGSRGAVEHRITTVSKQLALSAALLAQRAFGVVATVRKNRTPDTTTIEGRVVNQRDFYVVGIPRSNRSSFVEGAYGWKLCRTSERAGVGTVFNIAVDEDESYVADGAVVHNCQPFSCAGSRRGTDDPRHLWPDIARLIRETQPRRCFFENVPGHLSLGFDEVGADLQQMGYRVEAGIFSAAEAGASHRRERLFIMADAGCEGRWQESGSAPCDEGSDEGRQAQHHHLVASPNAALAHADGRNPGAERQQHGGQQRLLAQGDGAGGGDELADALGPVQEGWEPSAGEADSGRPHRQSGRSGRELGNSDSARLSQRQEPEIGRGNLRLEGPTIAENGRIVADTYRGRQRGKGHPNEQSVRLDRCLLDLPLSAPGPSDPRWPAILEAAPELVPATSRYARWCREVRNAGYAPHGNPAQGVPAGLDETGAERALRPSILSRLAQSLLRRAADDAARRVDRLRLPGNGVYALAAALAWSSLDARHAAATGAGELSVRTAA